MVDGRRRPARPAPGARPWPRSGSCFWSGRGGLDAHSCTAPTSWTAISNESSGPLCGRGRPGRAQWPGPSCPMATGRTSDYARCASASLRRKDRGRGLAM